METLQDTLGATAALLPSAYCQAALYIKCRHCTGKQWIRRGDAQQSPRQRWQHREPGRGELSHPCAPTQGFPGPEPAPPSRPSAGRGCDSTGSCPCPAQLSLLIRPCSFPYAKTSPGEAAAGKGIQNQRFDFFLHLYQPSSHSS